MMPSIRYSIQQATKQLEPVSDSAQLDAELLLCSVLKKERSFLHTWPERELEQSDYSLFIYLLIRRIKGEPVAHILGERDFWTLNLEVTPDTLIPRPETELLVELALEHIPQDQPLQILDLGTGSGAIALSLASERPLAHITATDFSSAALEVAKQNAAKHQLKNISFIQSRWFSEISNQNFDFIVSNPPYICEADPHLDQGDVRFEPRSALTSGKDGLDDIREIISQAHNYLSNHGVLLLEHGYDQADAICDLLISAGFEQVSDHFDYNNQPRVAIGHNKLINK
jgi:release factor glutamine methyltransferase